MLISWQPMLVFSIHAEWNSQKDLKKSAIGSLFGGKYLKRSKLQARSILGSLGKSTSHVSFAHSLHSHKQYKQKCP